jgi:TRAP-type uncharacterized transport system fused permease subunit
MNDGPIIEPVPKKPTEWPHWIIRRLHHLVPIALLLAGTLREWSAPTHSTVVVILLVAALAVEVSTLIAEVWHFRK